MKTVTYSLKNKTFCITTRAIAIAMLKSGNPYGHNMAKEYPNEDIARTAFELLGFTEV